MNIVSILAVYVLHTLRPALCKRVEVHRPYDRPTIMYLCRACGRSSEEYQ